MLVHVDHVLLLLRTERKWFFFVCSSCTASTRISIYFIVIIVKNSRFVCTFSTTNKNAFTHIDTASLSLVHTKLSLHYCSIDATIVHFLSCFFQLNYGSLYFDGKMQMDFCVFVTILRVKEKWNERHFFLSSVFLVRFNSKKKNVLKLLDG